MATISYALNERRFAECIDRIKNAQHSTNHPIRRLLDIDDNTLKDLQKVCEQELERRKGE